MQLGDDIPPIPRWFHGEIVALFALYPNVTLSQAVAPSWWRVMHSIPPEAVIEGFRCVLDSRPANGFMPTALDIRDHARSAAKSGYGSPRPDYSRVALSEPAPELPPDHPMYAELERINERVRSGELRGIEVMRAVVGAVVGKLP